MCILHYVYTHFIRHLPHRNFILTITFVTLAISLGHYVVGPNSDRNVLFFRAGQAPEAVNVKSTGILHTRGAEVQLHSVSTLALDGGKMVNVTLWLLYPRHKPPCLPK